MTKNFTDLSMPIQKKFLEQGKTFLCHRADSEEVKEGEVLILPGDRNTVCRIFSNYYGTVIFIRKRYKRKLEPFFRSLSFPDALLDSNLTEKILDELGANKKDYPYRKGNESEGRHGCRHITEWICTQDTFSPYDGEHKIDIFRREDVGWRKDEDFDDKLFRVMSGRQVAGYSGCKESKKSLAKAGENVYAVKVGTHEPYRNQGIGKAAASANIREILDNDGIAWGEIQVENSAATSVAKSLGFVFTGGELTIH